MGSPRRIAIVGNSGSGKTTLAAMVAERLGIAHIELDAIHHRAEWRPIEPEEMQRIVRQRTAAGGWVVDGNYMSIVQDIVLARADTVVWLDLPRRVVVPRVLRRSLRRFASRTELWNGNRERPVKLLDPRPRENIVLWSWARRDHYRERYAGLRQDPRYGQLSWVHITSSQAAREWLEKLGDRIDDEPATAAPTSSTGDRC